MSDYRKNNQQGDKNQKSSSSKINLSNQGIKDSDKILHELSGVAEVTEVDLSGNQMTVLPGDLWKLKKLQSLDITNNPFANVRKKFNLFSHLK
jgi:Leucine-rich repeat (LRR) protein